nr:protein NEN1-like isoform X2 [Quercus suber]
MSSSSGEERSEIAFFDVETTVPTQPGQRRALLEFGAILVCPRKLVELDSYSTFVRPADLSLISTMSPRFNGITPDAVVSAPPFLQISDRVYDLLHGRIWAGHNILGFDCARIREAFAEIGKPAPEPKDTIDSYTLLIRTFGRRAGDMKMATLATYFGLGQQTHRSLDDVRMNLEVLKYCAAVLLLESSLCVTAEEVEPNTAQRNPFDMGQLSDEMEESYETSSTESSEMYSVESSEMSFAVAVSDGRSDLGGFLEPDEVLTSSISASFVTFSKKIQLFHETILRLRCSHLKVWFGISTNFLDHAGRPRLNFVVNAPQSLCKVLDACDVIARNLSSDSGSSSEWWPVVVIRKDGFVNYPTVRLHIPYTESGDNPYETEMCQKDSGSEQKLVFSKYDPAELVPLFTPGTFVDAFFSIDPYDYQQNAGIRLVAKKLIIHSN